MDVDGLKWVAGLALAAVLSTALIRRRRTARRAAERRERGTRRRDPVPEVSANVRGLQASERDLWRDGDVPRGGGRGP